MGMKYGGVVWTDHALQRLKERGIKIEHALTTLNNPQESRYAKTRGAWIYYRTWGNDRIEVVSAQNKEKEWVVLSVWSKTVFGPSQAKSESWWKYVLRQIFGR
ncbi:DUF4258 domain-containing protein [Candidatus Microgenomates bacterium]|nr:MAG: DUF4258 domain-containing protein [Candidatus Microgenomates bacterium]